MIICAFTEQRWDDVLEAVASVSDQKTAPHEIILVVDHNPTLYRRLREELPDVAVIENTAAPGLSGGKNTGVAAATGSVVAFLDDDAVAEPDWLTHLVDGYRDPRVLAVGGATYPDWRGRGRPAWFPPEFDWVVGCSYRGLPTRPTPVRNPFGGNSSFRRWVFTTVGGFTTGIGRAASGRPLGCEETELSIRLRQRHPDAIVLYEPRAVIWHKVPPARATWRYFHARCYAEGLSKAAVATRVGTTDGLASERAYTLRTLPAGAARGLRDAARGQVAGLARAGAIVAGLATTAAGYATGRLHQRRNPYQVTLEPAVGPPPAPGRAAGHGQPDPGQGSAGRTGDGPGEVASGARAGQSVAGGAGEARPGSEPRAGLPQGSDEPARPGRSVSGADALVGAEAPGPAGPSVAHVPGRGRTDQGQGAAGLARRSPNGRQGEGSSPGSNGASSMPPAAEAGPRAAGQTGRR